MSVKFQIGEYVKFLCVRRWASSIGLVKKDYCWYGMDKYDVSPPGDAWIYLISCCEHDRCGRIHTCIAWYSDGDLEKIFEEVEFRDLQDGLTDEDLMAR